jgi:hypothetical protein
VNFALLIGAAGFVSDERKAELVVAEALHQHTLFLWQSVCEHIHLVLIARFIYFMHQFYERFHILASDSITLAMFSCPRTMKNSS